MITVTDAAKKQAELEIQDLIKKKESKSKLLATLTQEIINISKNPMSPPIKRSNATSLAALKAAPQRLPRRITSRANRSAG